MKKLFLILSLCLLSFVSAKEVDFNPTDFLGIKYGSTKKEVIEQLTKMDINIDKIYPANPDGKSEITLSDFNLSLKSNDINAISLYFQNDKFISTQFLFFDFKTTVAYNLYTKIVKENNLYLKTLDSIDSDMIGMFFFDAANTYRFNVGFCNCNNSNIEIFAIQLVKFDR
jgi:hypothetical protein